MRAQVFGRHHDGVYEKPDVEALPPSLEEAYEVGCPARGKLTADGLCQDDGSGAGDLCYSATRYEAGTQTGSWLGIIVTWECYVFIS